MIRSKPFEIETTLCYMTEGIYEGTNAINFLERSNRYVLTVKKILYNVDTQA